jgi:hypothetical protein
MIVALMLRAVFFSFAIPLYNDFLVFSMILFVSSLFLSLFLFHIMTITLGGYPTISLNSIIKDPHLFPLSTRACACARMCVRPRGRRTTTQRNLEASP